MATASPSLRPGPAGEFNWVLVAGGLVAFAAACGVSLALGEMEAMYLTTALALCIAVLFDFRIGVVTLVVVLPLQASAFFPHALLGVTGLNPQNLLLAATLGSYVLHGRLRHPGRFVPAPLAVLYVLPIVAAGIAGAAHVEEMVPYFYDNQLLNFNAPGGYLRDVLMKPLLLPLLALLLGAAAAASQKPERFLVPIALSVWLISLLVLGFVAASGVRLGLLAVSTERGFLSALGLHANDLGRLFALAYALLLFVWWETRRPGLKLFLFLTMGVLAFALLLTFSRGAFVGFILVNLLFLLWKFNLRTLGLALLALAVCAAFMPGYVIDRVLVGFETGAVDDISAGRVEGIWLPLLSEIPKAPLFGAGLLSTTWALPNVAGSMLTVTHPHNAYLEALLDMGVIGFALLAAYFWHVWRGFRALGGNAWLSPEMRGFFQGATAGLLCFLVTGFAGSSLRPTPESAYLWLAIGMMYGMAARKPAG